MVVIKRIHFYIFATALLAGILVAVPVLMSGCKKKAYTTDVDGGVRHRVDTNAPKKIESTQIVSFSCEFSTLTLSRENFAIVGRIFSLHAAQSNGSYEERTRERVYEKKDFTPTPEFFDKLQLIVAQYDFAQYNGQFYTVSGLPPNLGAKLEIRYASGESICASNNQSCFLPLDAMEKLVELFRQV